MDELPDAEIERAEGVNVEHAHDGVTSLDGTLLEHLRTMHTVAIEPGLSHSSQDGIHDRLHDQTNAVDDLS